MSDEKEAAADPGAKTPTEEELLQLSLDNGTIEVIIINYLHLLLSRLLRCMSQSVLSTIQLASLASPLPWTCTPRICAMMYGFMEHMCERAHEAFFPAVLHIIRMV